MELKFFQKTTIRELKKAFTKNFPFLKIEFFKDPRSPKEVITNKLRIPEYLTLSEVRALRREGTFSFPPSISISEFEHRVHKEFGLPVHVFRKTDVSWIETDQTGNLSLEKQNKIGETSSRPIRPNVNRSIL